MSYISIDKFAERYSVNVKTVQKRYKEIHVVEKHEGEFRVLEGSRYPLPIGRYKIDNAEDKRYALLKAISLFRYVDADMLNIPEQSFNLMVGALLDAGLIIENNIGNTYGANAYDCTPAGDEILRKKRLRAIKEIATIAGKFTGEVLATTIS